MVSRHQAFNVLDQLKGFKGKVLKTSQDVETIFSSVELVKSQP
jgi:hypothetical protein